MHRVYQSRLPNTDKCVLLAIIALLDAQGAAELRVADIAEYCSLSVRGVQRALASLQTAGVVVRDMSDGHPTVYAFRLQSLQVGR
jgi:DNA-binding IclR family transcriptional regulator